MAYQGITCPIPLGQLGLLTDEPMNAIPPGAAIKAYNVSLEAGRLEKAPGSQIYGTDPEALPSPIVGLHDWWPSSQVAERRLVAATASGELWLDNGTGDWGGPARLANTELQTVTFSVVPTGGTWKLASGANVSPSWAFNAVAATLQTWIRGLTGLSTVNVTGDYAGGFVFDFQGTTGDQVALTVNTNALTGPSTVTIAIAETSKGKADFGTFTTDVHFATGGSEVTASPRKLFFFSSVAQVQVLRGTGSRLYDIAKPSADWATGNFPTFGLVYQSRLVVMRKHTIYISRLDDHENFDSTVGTEDTPLTVGQQYNIYSGEGDELVGGIVFKGLLVLFKRPIGVYIFDWRDTSALPQIFRYSDSFSAASPHAAVLTLNDMLVGTNNNTVVSMQATEVYGSLEAGDVLKRLRVRNYIKQEFNSGGNRTMHAIYYGDKELSLFTGRNGALSTQNRILKLDHGKDSPRPIIETKDQPTCLILRRDDTVSADNAGVLRPVYGTNTGYVFHMDQTVRSVATASYLGEYQTPYMDFGFMDQGARGKTKQFDFLSLTFETVGSWEFFVDVYVDNEFVETLRYYEEFPALDGGFTLDETLLGSANAITQRRPMHCAGLALSLRIYNGGLAESFRIEGAEIGFRIAGEQARSSRSGS